MRPLLLTLGDYRNLTLNGTKRLSYLTQLFPSMFNEKLCEQLLQHICKMLEISIAANKGKNFLSSAKTGETELKMATILDIFHQIPAATNKFIETLCRLILQTEKSLMIEPSCPFRQPLVKFLLRYPQDTMDLLTNEINVKDPQNNRFVIYLLKHKDGEQFREVMQYRSSYLVQLILCTVNTYAAMESTMDMDASMSTMGSPLAPAITSPIGTAPIGQAIASPMNQSINQSMDAHSMVSPMALFTPEEQYEAQHQAIAIIETLMEFDENWLSTQDDIISALKVIWESDLYKSCETNVACDLWHMVAKIFLHYFSHHTNDIDLLFMLLKALCLRFIPDFQVILIQFFCFDPA